MFLISVIMIILFLVIVSKQNKKDKDEIEYLKSELFRAEDKSNYILNKIASKYPEFADEILKEYYNNQRAGEYSQPDYNVNQNVYYNENVNAESILNKQESEKQEVYNSENINAGNILNNQKVEKQDIYHSENINAENILENQKLENQEVYNNENVNAGNILNNQESEKQDIYHSENILNKQEVENQDISNNENISENQDIYYDTTYISRDIKLVNKRKVVTKSEEQIKQERIKFNSILSLCLGAVFIMISGLVFATTTWKILPNFIKLISLAIFAVLFYVASFVAYKKLDIIRTAKTFYVLGSIYVFVFVLAAGYFRLLGEYLSIRGSGRFLLFFIGMFFTEISLIYGLKLFREKWYGYICASGVSICFGLLVYTFTYEIKSLSFYYGIFAVVLIMIDRYKLINRLSQMFEPVKIIYPRYSQVSFILACTMIAAFHRNNLSFAAVMLLLSAVCIFLTYRDRKAEYLPFGLFLIVLVIFKLIHIKGIYELMYKVLILNVMGISLRLIKLSKKKEDVVYSEISENILKFIKYIPYVTCVVLEIFVLKDIYNPYFLVVFSAFMAVLMVIWLNLLDNDRQLSVTVNIAFYIFSFALFEYINVNLEIFLAVYLTVLCVIMLSRRFVEKTFKVSFTKDAKLIDYMVFICAGTSLIMSSTELFLRCTLNSVYYTFLILVNVFLIHKYDLKVKLSAAFNIVFYVFAFTLINYFIKNEEVNWLIYVIVTTLLLLGKDTITKYTKQEFDLSSDFASLAASVSLNFIFTFLIVSEYFVLDWLSILGVFLVLVNVILIHRLTLKIKLSLAVNIVIYVFMYTIYRYIGIDVRLYIATVVIVSCIFILTNEIMLRFLKTEFDKISLIASAIVSVAFNINLFFDLYKPFRVFYREDIYSSIVPSWAMVVKSADTIYANIALLISLLFLLVVFIKYKNKILVLKYFDHIIQIGSILICGNLLALGLNIFIRTAYLVFCYIIIYMVYTTYKKESIDKLIVIISVIAGVLDFTNAIYSEYYILTPYLLVLATYIVIKLYFIKPTFEINENSQNLWNRLWIALCLVGIYLQLITTKTFDSYNSIIVLFIVFISFSVIRALFIKYFGKELLKSYFDKILIVVFLSNIVCFAMSDNNMIYVFMISFILLASHAYYYISYNNSFDLTSSIMGIPVMILISYKLMDLSANQKFIIICAVLVIICAISRYFYDIYINVGKLKNVYDWFSVFSIVYLIIFVLGVDTKFYSVLLLAISAYIWQYRCIKKFEKPLLTLSLLIVTVAFWIQQFVTINKLIVQEYYMLVLAISTFSLKFIYKEEREKLAKFQNAIYTLCIFILGVFAVDEGNVNNAIIYILICIFTFVIAIIYKNKFMRNVGFGFALLTALYMTRDFWLSIGWWAILLVLGILLIVFAATNEKRKK